MVEGGDNSEIPAKFHPFYISDDPEGGYQHKSEADRKVGPLTAVQVPSIIKCWELCRKYGSLPELGLTRPGRAIPRAPAASANGKVNFVALL